MALYESEHTQFMREWLEKHPQERREQAAGRALWWDRPPHEADMLKRQAESKVAQKAYYYDTNS